MTRTSLRAALIALGIGLVAVLAAGCGASEDAPKGAKKMAFKLTDAGCEPSAAKAPAGPINFEVENAGTSKVTEMEVLDGETVLGEKENLTEGLSGSFALTLEQGEYTIYCPGGDNERGTLTVSGKLDSKDSPEVEAAIAQYREYLKKNTDELVAKTTPFVAAVVAGNIAEAKALYPAARVPYERIEPVAESFGDLDPRIDARENDVPPSKFEGFHRIEKALWAENTAKGMAPVAEQLLADVKELQGKVKNVNLQAVQIANGANELLGEVSASKIEGAQVAFEAVEPLLVKSDPKLAKEIEASFKQVYASLDPYRDGAGFVSYEELTQADTRKLAREIDTLAEQLSQVPAQIVGG